MKKNGAHYQILIRFYYLAYQLNFSNTIWLVFEIPTYFIGSNASYTIIDMWELTRDIHRTNYYCQDVLFCSNWNKEELLSNLLWKLYSAEIHFIMIHKRTRMSLWCFKKNYKKSLKISKGYSESKFFNFHTNFHICFTYSLLSFIVLFVWGFLLLYFVNTTDWFFVLCQVSIIFSQYSRR